MPVMSSPSDRFPTGERVGCDFYRGTMPMALARHIGRSCYYSHFVVFLGPRRYATVDYGCIRFGHHRDATRWRHRGNPNVDLRVSPEINNCCFALPGPTYFLPLALKCLCGREQSKPHSNM